MTSRYCRSLSLSPLATDTALLSQRMDRYTPGAMVITADSVTVTVIAGTV